MSASLDLHWERRQGLRDDLSLGGQEALGARSVSQDGDERRFLQLEHQADKGIWAALASQTTKLGREEKSPDS